MNIAVFKEAQTAYSSGDYRAALEGFIACAKDTSGLSASDLSKFYHLIGNCYVKSGDPYTAAAFYAKALSGSPEKRKPSLYVNLGTALLGTKDYDEALSAFTHALDYPIYTTPYKAYSGIGAVQLKLGNTAKAGAAYRAAALDHTNPAPAKALVNLGVCFMELGRAEDAVTTYETALEFDLDDEAKAKALANLGQAYMAQGRVQRAIDAFEQATENGNTELSSIAQHDYDLALALKSRLEPKAPGILGTGYIPVVSAADQTQAASARNEAFAGAQDEVLSAAANEAAPDATAEVTSKNIGAQDEMKPSKSGHLPVYGEPGFDPFAPQTQPMEAIVSEGQGEEAAADQAQAAGLDEALSEKETAGGVAHDADEAGEEKDAADADEQTATDTGLGEMEHAAAVAGFGLAGIGAAQGAAAQDASGEPVLGEDASMPGEGPLDESGGQADAGKTEAMTPIDGEAGDRGTGHIPIEQHTNALDNANDEFGILGRDDGGVDFESTETHMPSPEDTQFFDITEQQIARGVREGRRKKRKARGVGLKLAIALVVVCILLAGAACAAYVMGFGYPLQEDVAEDFFAAAQAGEDTSQYWADPDEEGSHEAQLAVLEGLSSYNVEAVQRQMQQSTVYVKGTLTEGGQVDYELVMSRRGASWAVEYVQLWFASQQ